MNKGSNEKPILLVEDNDDDLALTMRAFERNEIGNPLIVARDGAEAIEILLGQGNENPLPELILLDIKLPKVDGLEVLRQIRANPRTRITPVVMLTSSAEENDVLVAYDNGANSYVRKPVSMEEFFEVVRHLGLYWLLVNERPPRVGP